MNASPETKPNEMIPLAREALTEAPVFVDHILNTFALSGQNLREGNDQDGLNGFARGASDLAQFIKMFDHISAISQKGQEPKNLAFKSELADCVRSLDSALRELDLVALSDRIELNLIPLFEQWEDVEQELSSGLQA